MENENSKFKKEFKQRLYNWVLKLIELISSLPKDMPTNVIAKQLMRSGTSILANYIEANSASSKKDFVNYFTHSLKSANESKVWLTLLIDTNKGNKNKLEWLLEELIEISKILASSIMTMKKKI